MPNYPNLPGSTFAIRDGGLRSAVVFANKPTLVLGTSAQGPVGRIVQSTDAAQTAALFGLSGTLIKGLAEVLTHSDNVQLWRLGTAPATLTGVGATSSEAGLTLTLGQRQANTGSIYKIWYANGAVYLWLNGNLVYANDAVNNIFEDSTDSIVDGTATAGLNLCAETGIAFPTTGAVTVGQQIKPAVYNGFNFVVTVAGTTGASEPTWNAVMAATTVSGTATFQAVSPSVPNVNNAIAVSAAPGVTVSGNLVAPVFVAANDGTGMTARQTYIALADALDLLSTSAVSQVYCPNALIDNPNVAFYVSADSTTAIHNPAVNVNALGWLKTSVDAYGTRTYLWAQDTADTFASPGDRIAQGFHEVNFGYLLARFAASQQEELGGCTAFIGTNGPGFYNGSSVNRFDLLSTRKFVGAIPSYDLSGNPVSFGVGVCGIPYLVGTTSSKLNPLTVDFSQGYRKPGFFENDSQEYDGGVNSDPNGNPIDIGQYLHVVYDYQALNNSYSTSYVANLAGVVAGKAATLDQKQALTYKQLNGVIPIWAPNFAQMDALSFAKVNGIRGDEAIATLMHDNTAALVTSDWYSLYNVNLRFMLTNIGYTRGKTFLGTNALNGLQAAALKTALDADASILQTRGYISSADFQVVTTASDARIGQVAVNTTFSAPGQLRKLKFSIGIRPSV